MRITLLQAATLSFATLTSSGRAPRAEASRAARPLAIRAPAAAERILAPGLSARTLELGLRAYRRALEGNVIARGRLTVIDYSLPSTEPRLWVIDPESGAVLFAERVAHGRGSGELLAKRFGNAPSSHLTSLGVFRTAETYQGAHGYSLRIDGLDAGVNDRAREREIVFHGASYATEAFGREHGRLGRSYGCPALDPRISRAVIDEIRGGSLVVAVSDDSSWIAASTLAGG